MRACGSNSTMRSISEASLASFLAEELKRYIFRTPYRFSRSLYLSGWL
jgi:hypothetical protein